MKSRGLRQEMWKVGWTHMVWGNIFVTAAGELYEVAKNVGPAAGPDQPELDAEDKEGCRVPPTMNPSDCLVLFEADEGSQVLEHLLKLMSRWSAKCFRHYKFMA
ncbi:unnamed protein product [Merluccius merluccius]